MLGFRGASRYIARASADCFEMECKAMKKVRNELGLTNVQLMSRSCAPWTKPKVWSILLAEHGLKRRERL